MSGHSWNPIFVVADVAGIILAFLILPFFVGLLIVSDIWSLVWRGALRRIRGF